MWIILHRSFIWYYLGRQYSISPNNEPLLLYSAFIRARPSKVEISGQGIRQKCKRAERTEGESGTPQQGVRLMQFADSSLRLFLVIYSTVQPARRFLGAFG